MIGTAKDYDDIGVVALFPTISNPPTFGTILTLRYIEKYFEKIFVVVYDKPRLLQTDDIVEMLQLTLDPTAMKYVVISSDVDFSNITVLPSTLPKHDTIITVSDRIFANFVSKGYTNCKMIPDMHGWDELLHRTAFHRSIALNKLKRDIEKYKKSIGE